MNTILHKIAAPIILAISIALTSCQQENTITPDAPANITLNQSDANAKTNDLVPAEKYRLIEHGLNPITYVNGKLASSQTEYGPWDKLLTLYEYKNTRSSAEIEIKATVYTGGEIGKISIYKVNLNTGLCVESTSQVFSLPGYLNQPKDPKPKTWSYIYNAQGQLEKRFNKNNLLEWFKYDYGNGDMRRATTYDATGKRVREIWFDYAQPSGQQLKKNLYPLYIEAADLPDRFLKIFGKSSEHLLTSVSKKYVPLIPEGPYEHLYTYEYNQDGWVTGESKFRKGETSLFEYRRFKYETLQ